MDLDPQLADRVAVAAVQFVGERPAEAHPDPAAARHAYEGGPIRLARGDAGEDPGPVGRVPCRDHPELEQAVVRLGAGEQIQATEGPADVPG